MKLGVIKGSSALLAIVVTAVLFLQPGSAFGDREAMHIASNLPMTGNLATYGAAVRNGVIMALEDLDKASPMGPRLIFDWQDNAGSPQTAVSIMQKQYLRSPDIYISGVKPQTMAILNQITAKGTPHFVWIFDAFVTRDVRSIFRTWVNYSELTPYGRNTQC